MPVKAQNMPINRFFITFLLISLFQFFFINNAGAADVLPLDSILTFGEAERIALENSHLIESQRYAVETAKEVAAAQRATRYPGLSFQASSSFSSKIGRIEFPQLGLQKEIGDHTNWSVGPALNWVVWDTGQIMKKAKSLQMKTSAEGENLENDRRQVLLNVRTVYINVQLAKEQRRLIDDALRLARAQYAYVLKKKEAGTADLLDLTVAHQEVVDREKDLEQANGDLAISKRALIAVLGFDAEKGNPDELDVEAIKGVLNALLPRSDMKVDVESHPQVMALSDMQRSSELAAKSSSAQHWPLVTLQGTATFEYPNLGENKTIQQNRLMLGLGLPIVDWGKINKEVRSYRYQAYSASEQKKQTAIDLSRAAAETRERIQTFKELRIANEKAVRDAVEVARLSFDSYKAGRIIFLDVQRANVRALAAKVDAARNDANLAVQISNLLALAEGEGDLQ